MFRFKPAIARFRSAERDASVDRERVTDILRTVRQAVISAEKEKSGLDRRLEEASIRASLLAGNDLYEHVSRHPAESSQLTSDEIQMHRAHTRILELERQIAKLKLIEDSVRDAWPDISS